ncbi:hypothetical protein FOC4_g10010062 [Fusarium odoratissimum]|uniref:Zn(2)-C6 fungal-type domain-containing protein n=1 Tax=Fusarium oxysporum f. sp. cubense (strain race 4) TaxID=2502994 RepID=N1S4V2_FUSC4|nr:hypothetical protein FOC4_g10010062 [Fusarium odoratissimum]
MEQLSPCSSSSPNRSQVQKRRPRKPLNCDPCRHSKLKCDRGLPCATCLKRGWQDSCAYGSSFTGPQKRRRTRLEVVDSVPQQQVQVQSVEVTEIVSSPSSTPEPIQQRWDHILRRPSVERSVIPDSPNPTVTLSFGPCVPITQLLALLPPTSVTEYLVCRYFGTLSSLFHILHGPTFQTQYLDFLEAPEKTSLSWLAVLFAIISLTLKTIEPTDAGLVVLWQDTTIPRDLSVLSQKYRNAAMTALSQDQFLVRHDLSTLEALLILYDTAVAKEQLQWDAAYLVNGRRSILNTAGYAHWCMLQTYAHQLYLLLHRPYHSSKASHFRAESRDKCIKSGLALLDVHHQFYELPRLKCYRWLVKGAISCNALHGAVALTSCMLDMPDDSDLTEHIFAIDAAITRMEALKMKSPACSSVYRVIRCLRSYLSKRDPAPTFLPEDVELRFEDWATNVDWFRPDGIDWVKQALTHIRGII